MPPNHRRTEKRTRILHDLCGEYDRRIADALSQQQSFVYHILEIRDVFDYPNMLKSDIRWSTNNYKRYLDNRGFFLPFLPTEIHRRNFNLNSGAMGEVILDVLKFYALYDIVAKQGDGETSDLDILQNLHGSPCWNEDALNDTRDDCLDAFHGLILKYKYLFMNKTAQVHERRETIRIVTFFVST